MKQNVCPVGINLAKNIFRQQKLRSLSHPHEC